MTRAASQDAIRSRIRLRIGQNITAHRRVAGLSQEELGLRIGLSRACMNGVERGRHNLNVLVLLRIAQVLLVNPGDLLEQDPLP